MICWGYTITVHKNYRAHSHRTVPVCQEGMRFPTLVVAKHRDETTSTDKLAGVEARWKYSDGRQE